MKQKMPNPQLSVFQTFKTKGKELTGEAIRQRGIVMHLALETIPTKKTRTAIAHKLAERNGTTWQNIYSGIFRDLDEILLPLKIVEEAGRLPIKRGPKALQEEGVPYYQLTEGGLLVAASLEEMEKERRRIIEYFFEKNSNSKDKDFKKSMLILLNVAPIFISSILRKYVEAYSIGKIDHLIPFDANSVRDALDEAIIIQRELLEGFASLANLDKEPIINFLKSVG